MEMENMQDVQRYLNVKRINDASAHTIRNQALILEQYRNFLNGKPFRQTTEEDVFAFLTHKKEHGKSRRKGQKKITSGTIGAYKIVLKAFYRFLYELPIHQYPHQVKNLNGVNAKTEFPITPETVIEKTDVLKLVEHCKNNRDKAIVTMLYESGCRLGEFVNMDVKDLKFDKYGVIVVVKGKTGMRRLRLVESVIYLKRWLNDHPKKDDALWVYLREPHERLSEPGVYALLMQLKKRSKLQKPVHPHAFRHSRLTELAKYLSDAKLRKFAGWTPDSPMTGIYVHISGKDLDDDLLQLAGVKKTNDIEPSLVLGIKCPTCEKENEGNNKFCAYCGNVLDTKYAMNREFELEEKLQVAEDVMDDMWNVIDTLKQEIAELKSKQQ